MFPQGDAFSSAVAGALPSATHAKAFAIATKFQVTGMAELAVTRFKTAMKNDWNKDCVAAHTRGLH